MTTWPWIWTWEIPPYHTGGVKKKVFTNFLQNGRHWLCKLTWKKEKIMKINFETPYQIYVYLSIYLSIYLSTDWCPLEIYPVLNIQMSRISWSQDSWSKSQVFQNDFIIFSEAFLPSRSGDTFYSTPFP